MASLKIIGLEMLMCHARELIPRLCMINIFKFATHTYDTMDATNTPFNVLVNHLQIPKRDGCTNTLKQRFREKKSFVDTWI